ncbi:MAG: hypothetical protein LUE61_04705 [Clostridiales bacterium]|nr:hypothetical protein [Clostridiales bacterium]
MYIMVLPDGYLQIDTDTKGFTTEEGSYISATYYIEEYEGENALTVDLTLTPGETPVPVKIAPFGQIILNRFNLEWKRYKDHGGKRDKAPGPHTIVFSDPCGVLPPHLDTTLSHGDNKYLAEIDFELIHYLQVYYIQFMGQATPVFKVDDLADLYFYDLEQVTTRKIKIKQCKACGLAFIATGKTLYCDACKNDDVPNKMKYERLKNDPTRLTLKQITGRNRPATTGSSTRRDSCIDDEVIHKEVGTYYSRLSRVIAKHKEEDTEEQLAAFAAELNEMDMRYFALCKKIQNDNYWVSKALYIQWCNEKTQFPEEVTNMREWIEKWEHLAS